ncbi:hypothetical protein ABKN59_010137 [Abortiporus biennis]
MERYCGWLQPSIRSRRFPYASLNRFVLDDARFRHIKLVYSIEDQLRLGPPKRARGVNFPDYATCTLLQPRRASVIFSQALLTKVTGHLCTRFNTTPAKVREVLPKDYEEWGKVQIFEDGDLVHSLGLQRRGEDSRDASFVRYEMLVDRNAHSRRRAVELVPKTFYGQLERILAVRLRHQPEAPQSSPQTILLAAIRTCRVNKRHKELDIHYYEDLGPLEIVDLNSIQCLVGRICDRKQWAIIDRSGALSRAVFVDTGIDSEEV